MSSPKKIISALSDEQRLSLFALREEKEVGRFLLPDAPERKKKRKVSPTRTPCPLMVGVSAVPRLRVLQPWQIMSSKMNEPVLDKKNGDAVVTSGFSTFSFPNSPEPAPSDQPLELSLEASWKEMPDSPVPGKSSMNYQPLESSPEVHGEAIWKENAIPHKERKLVFTTLTGLQNFAPAEIGKIDLVENVHIQIIEFLPSSTAESRDSIESTPSQSPTLTQESPASGSSTSYRDDPNTFDEATETFLDYMLSREGNPGSDVEEDELDFDLAESPAVISRTRDVTEFPSNLHDIPPLARAQLEDIDARDNAALREMPDMDLFHFDWSHDPTVFKGQRELFIGQAGPTFSTDGLSPLSIFEKFWDKSIIEQIVRETNRYANDLLNDPTLKAKARINRWKNVTEEELWLFFGIIMLQSIIPVPVEKEFWYPCLKYLQVGQFGDIMPYSRFLLLKRCLHFVDNATLPQGVSGDRKKLAKVQPVIDHLNEKFSSLYLPEQTIVIDESLLLWKGRLSFVQLNATKAASVGIKSYELCESRTGYLWKFIIYTGKSDKQQKPVDELTDSNNTEPERPTSKVVFNLVRPLLNKGHTLVMDNIYNSPLLSRTLKKLKTDTMGTLRLTREFVPDSLRNSTKTNMRTGEVAFSHTNDLAILTWKDTNVVSMISTYHTVEVGGKEKFGYYKYKPKVVLDYNLSMGGVDKKDQMLQAFPVERVRNSIWYKKLFRRLLNVSIYNACVIYQHKKKITQRQFRVQLADEIITKYVPTKKTGATVPKEGHFAMKNQTGRARCKWCAKHKVDTRTVWKCDTCDVDLCIMYCFKSYHLSLL